MGADARRQIARAAGFAASPDIPIQAPGTVPRVSSDVSAKLLGARVAWALRANLGLGAASISNKALANLFSTSQSALVVDACGPDPSFLVNEDERCLRMAPRSRWHTKRRFEVARLLRDRLMSPAEESLPCDSLTHLPAKGAAIVCGRTPRALRRPTIYS